MTSWKQRRERGDTTEYQDRAMTWMEQNVLKETQGQLHGCATCAVSPSPTHWRALCLVQCSASHLEIYNDFIHELRFCEWRWIGQWSLPMSRADLCNMCVLHSLLPLSHRAFGMPQEHWIPVDTMCGSSVPLKMSMKAGCFESHWTSEFHTGLTALKNCAFHSNQVALKAERRQW